MSLNKLFSNPKPVIGVVHCKALPGAPKFNNNLEEVLSHALKEAKNLESGGVHAIIIENFNDAPFFPNNVPPETTAALTVIAHEIKKNTTIPIGINVLRNDAHAALAIATATNAEFIRINIHTGATLTDQGIIEGKAFHTLRTKKQLQSKALIFADIAVKHASPLAPQNIIQEAEDATKRGMADAIIISGSGTGKEANPEDIEAIKNESNIPVLIGSGMTTTSLQDFHNADGYIVGTHFKTGQKVENDTEIKQVKEFMALHKSIKTT